MRPIPSAPSALLALVAITCAAPSAGEWKPEPLSRADETAVALEACPSVLREQAGVYVLTGEGYELARPSGNGFHAVVERSQPDAFEPQCLDAEGSRTTLQEILLRGELQMSGRSTEEIRAELGAAWREGRLQAPGRPGINYMLSERNRVPISPDQVISYQPHVMFYAPYLTDADIGGDPRGGGSPVFVVNQGAPSAYVIVPVGHDDEGGSAH